LYSHALTACEFSAYSWKEVVREGAEGLEGGAEGEGEGEGEGAKWSGGNKPRKRRAAERGTWEKSVRWGSALRR
jgi:hypothetical protein